MPSTEAGAAPGSHPRDDHAAWWRSTAGLREAVAELQEFFERPPSPLFKPSRYPAPGRSLGRSAATAAAESPIASGQFRRKERRPSGSREGAEALGNNLFGPRKPWQPPLQTDLHHSYDEWDSHGHDDHFGYGRPQDLQIHDDDDAMDDDDDGSDGVGGGALGDGGARGQDEEGDDDEEEVIPILRSVAQARAMGETARRTPPPASADIPRSSLSAMLMRRSSAAPGAPGVLPSISFSAAPPGSGRSSRGAAASSHSESAREPPQGRAAVGSHPPQPSLPQHSRRRPLAEPQRPAVASPAGRGASPAANAQPSPIIDSVFAAAAAAAAKFPATPVPTASSAPQNGSRGIRVSSGEPGEGGRASPSAPTPASTASAAAPASASSSSSRRRRQNDYRVPKTSLPMLAQSCSQLNPDWDHERACYLCGLYVSRLGVRSNAASPRIFPLAGNNRLLLKCAGLLVGPFPVGAEGQGVSVVKRSVHLLCALWATRPDPGLIGTLEQARQLLEQPDPTPGSAAAELQLQLSTAMADCRDVKCSYCGETRASVPCIRESCGNHFHLVCALKLPHTCLREDHKMDCPKHSAMYSQELVAAWSTSNNAVVWGDERSGGGHLLLRGRQARVSDIDGESSAASPQPSREAVSSSAAAAAVPASSKRTPRSSAARASFHDDSDEDLDLAELPDAGAPVVTSNSRVPGAAAAGRGDQTSANPPFAVRGQQAGAGGGGSRDKNQDQDQDQDPEDQVVRRLRAMIHSHSQRLSSLSDLPVATGSRRKHPEEDAQGEAAAEGNPGRVLPRSSKSARFAYTLAGSGDPRTPVPPDVRSADPVGGAAVASSGAPLQPSLENGPPPPAGGGNGSINSQLAIYDEGDGWLSLLPSGSVAAPEAQVMPGLDGGPNHTAAAAAVVVLGGGGGGGGRAGPSRPTTVAPVRSLIQAHVPQFARGSPSGLDRSRFAEGSAVHQPEIRRRPKKE